MGSATRNVATQVHLTRIPHSWAWMWPDVLVRLLPFTVAFGAAYALTRRATWLGLQTGDVAVQLTFAVVAVPSMFLAAAAVQLWLTRRRGALSVPAAADDAWFQAAFYVVNGPVEEAFFRGLMQGGLSVLWGAPAGFLVATAIYVVYHRLGRWPWMDTLSTALVGVPLGLAYWLLPGPPSLLGISLAHIAATCGFLGPGPYLLHRLRLV
ncbi:MAG TPA: CPBP family intramembrane glutamic endopeptidase [Candidatus Dormibacteraeota bacterium]|nr:CPBP family intramembrane glutamic endopeptidase [Candidatus Dormibacteraeota bacterium]